MPLERDGRHFRTSYACLYGGEDSLISAVVGNLNCAFFCLTACMMVSCRGADKIWLSCVGYGPAGRDLSSVIGGAVKESCRSSSRRACAP